MLSNSLHLQDGLNNLICPPSTYISIFHIHDCIAIIVSSGLCQSAMTHQEYHHLQCLPDGAMEPSAPRAQASIVRRWNMSVVIGWRVASGIFDRVAQRKGNAKTPVFCLDVFAHALLLHHDAASLRSFLGFQANVLHYLRFSPYYKLRPQVREACLLAECACSL